jgi:hypothetical protein
MTTREKQAFRRLTYKTKLFKAVSKAALTIGEITQLIQALV